VDGIIVVDYYGAPPWVHRWIRFGRSSSSSGGGGGSSSYFISRTERDKFGTSGGLGEGAGRRGGGASSRGLEEGEEAF